MYLCCKDGAERNKGVDRVFAKICPRIRRFSRRRLEDTPPFTFDVESDVCLLLGGLSSVRCGPGRPRIAHSQNGPSNSAVLPSFWPRVLVPRDIATRPPPLGVLVLLVVLRYDDPPPTTTEKAGRSAQGP